MAGGFWDAGRAHELWHLFVGHKESATAASLGVLLRSARNLPTDSSCGLELNVCPGKTTPPGVPPKFPCKKLSVFIFYDTKKKDPGTVPKPARAAGMKWGVLVPPYVQ